MNKYASNIMKGKGSLNSNPITSLANHDFGQSSPELIANVE